MPEFLWTAVSRSGVYGPFDIPYNILYGMRFERNLTSVSSGAGVAYTLSHIQNVLKAFPSLGCNSPNTNKAEHTAVKSAYLLTVGPFLSALLSRADAGSATCGRDPIRVVGLGGFQVCRHGCRGQG
jgi:hypothetical protein